MATNEPFHPTDHDKAKLAFARLLTIMDELREHCPWDKKQTFDSLRHLTIEETYELGDAILDKDLTEIKKELGDLLLHIVFYARLGSEEKERGFTIVEVLNEVCDKLIQRHPHIYGDEKAATEEEVKTLWEKTKKKHSKKSVLSGVPNTLPAMVKAYRIQSKARGVGFDWENAQQTWEKVKEELAEFESASREQNAVEQEKEFGDLLFSLINYARFKNINPEDALERTNKKFIKRFSYIERYCDENGISMEDLSLEKMDEIWNKAKTHTS